MGFTVLSMSVSLIAVFIPILLMGGLPGRLFREFAVTLSAAILISMLVSLTLTPMMAAHLLRRPAKQTETSVRLSFLARFIDAVNGYSVRGYGRSLDWALRHCRLMMLLLAATVGLNFYLYSAVPKGFFPQQDTGMMLGFFSTDDGTSFESMKPKLDRFRQVLLRDPAISTVTAYASGRGGSNSSFLAVQLKPFAERKI